MTDLPSSSQSPSVPPAQAALRSDAPRSNLSGAAGSAAGAAEAVPPQETFRRIYDSEFKPVWHSLRRFGVWERDLEDAAHEVFVVLYRRWSSYDPARPIRPYLFGIAFRVASDMRKRAQARHETVTEEVHAVSAQAAPDTQIASKQSRDLVHRALDTLDADKRAIFVLHELEGLSIPDAVPLLQAPLNTLYSRLRLARKEFTDAVRRLQALDAGNAQARLLSHAQPPSLSPTHPQNAEGTP